MFQLRQILSIVWFLAVIIGARPAFQSDAGALHASTIQPAVASQSISSLEWKQIERGNVRVYALPGTAAARELDAIGDLAHASVQRMERRLGARTNQPLDIYLIERIFWHGGAAYGNDVLISYPDRTYTGVPLRIYLDHEITHAIARQFVPEGEQTNLLLAEGLAVWATGGHYAREPYHALAAALSRSEAYIPIGRLLRDFRSEQHELAYIEAGSFVGWLIETRGLAAVKQLYARADDPEAVLGQSYAQLEQQWRAMLALQPAAFQDVRAFVLQVRAFDAVRGYQTEFDPFAREIPARPAEWTPSQRERYQDNVDQPTNLALETMLGQAQHDLRCGRLDAAGGRLADIERSVDAEQLVGTELRTRYAIAEILYSQNEALQTDTIDSYLATIAPAARDATAAILAQYRNRIQAQEVAQLDVSAGATRASVFVWWRMPDQDQSIPIHIDVENTNGQWQVVAVREAQMRSQNSCNALQMASTIVKRTVL